MRAVFILIALLFSCSVKKEYKTKFNFNYEITDNYKTSLIQVFDNSQITYLHFLDLDKLKIPQVFYNKRKLSYKTRNNYLILESTYRNLEVVVGKYSSSVKNLKNKSFLSKISKKGEKLT